MFDELIGREHAVGALRAHVERAVASHGGLVLVTGEAGIGKTTLVTRAAEEARRLGALVLGGACWDAENAPGYWPWVQVVRAMRRSADADAWAEAREEAGDALGVLLGEAPTGDGAGGPEGSRGTDGTDGDQNFELSDAVTTLLVTASHRRPVVVVLDDLHWADAASLRLLRFVAQHTWFERLLLVGTYRAEDEAHREGPATALGPRATTISLAGLEPAEVGALMARTTGHEPDPALVAEVHRRTGGNPFFVEQTSRLWQSGGAVAAIPPGVRDAVRRRLRLLPEPVAGLLTGAAVLGREFHRQLLAAAERVPVPEADRLLDQAAAARLVTPLGAGRFAFAHDLVRETLYEELAPDRVAERHAAVVRALDRQPGLAARIGVLPAELAHHAHLADRALPPARALELLREAATDATGRMAFEEATGHLRRAYELAAAVDPRRRVTTGLILGQQLMHGGGEATRAEAWTLMHEVVSEARALDDPELLARVALSLYQTDSWIGHGSGPGELTTEVLREAIERLAPGDAPAGAGPVPGASVHQLVRQLTVRSAVLARRSADDDALGFSLAARHDALWGLGTAAERAALTAEMVEVARRTDDAELEHFGMSLRWVALLELGDPGYQRQFAAFVARVETLGVPRFHFSAVIDRCIIATLQGRLAEADELQRRAMELGHEEEGHHEHFTAFSLHLRWAILLLTGRFEELGELHASLTTKRYPHPELIAGLTAARRGDTATLLRVHDDLAGRAEELPRSVRPMWLRLQAQAAAASRDPVLCARARAALEPFAGLWAVSMWGFDVGGPISLWTALLDAAEERWDAAIEGFTAAARSADLLRARPWALIARGHLSDALAARAGPGDAEAATALRNEVTRESAALGVPPDTLRLPAGPSPTAPRPWNAPGPGRPGEPHADRPRPGAAAGGPLPIDRAKPETGPGAPARDGHQGDRPADTHGRRAERPEPEARGPEPEAGSGAPAGDGHEGDRPADGQRAERLGPGAGPGATGSGGGTASPGKGNVFRFDGAVWVLTFAGRTVHLPDAKGLRDLRYLLGRPGTDVPATELAHPEGGAEAVAAHAMGGDPVLDDEARARYRRHLARLDEEIERADALGQDDRAAGLDRERAALLDELRAAAGLGGRARRLGDEAERARKAVTARIRDTLRRLDQHHPELAGHLRGSVTTGARCAYRPPDRDAAPWTL
ncbi:AAA family ATPase [Streptomyces sp. B6B3]|uniref:AAA family ATPase n=1 Tax=Streptomyces sp. B6B3 TaxID=3153570 RepID=UPI00325C6060